MNTHLVAHYGSTAPVFVYAETLEEARSSALTLSTSPNCKPDDIVSIVDTVNDSIVYYGKRDEVIARFYADNDKKTTTGSSWFLPFKQLITWVRLKVAGPIIG
ncbi:MAG: hypothetical protein JWP57_2920 [Spirosoma sp.]|nr:hypothetical protein [Spirosoma sp.]